MKDHTIQLLTYFPNELLGVSVEVLVDLIGQSSEGVLHILYSCIVYVPASRLFL